MAKSKAASWYVVFKLMQSKQVEFQELLIVSVRSGEDSCVIVKTSLLL